MLHSYGKAGIRPAILLSLFAKWAKDNPTLGADDFANAFFVPLGIKYRPAGSGYSLTRVLPKHATVTGDNQVTDQSGNDISGSVRVNRKTVGEDVLPLTPTNLGSDSLVQFFHHNPFYSPGTLDVDRSAEWFGKLGLTSLPYPFNSSDLAIVRRAIHYTQPCHAFDAIASVAGFHIPYFAGGVASGQAFVTEPGCSWILSELETDGSVSFHKLSPSADWSDSLAVQSGFVPSVSMGHLKVANSQTCESMVNADRGKFGLVSCGRFESPTDGASTMESQTRLDSVNPLISCKTAVLKLAITSMLQWARGERRSCDSPVMPGFGRDDAIVTKLPVDPLCMGFEPVWETPISDPVQPMGDANVAALETLVKRLVADMKLTNQSTSANGPTSDRMAPDMSLVGKLFSKIRLVPDRHPSKSSKPGLVLDSGSRFGAERVAAIEVFEEPLASKNCVAFNKFRGYEAKRITDRISPRKVFPFLGMGKVSFSSPWVAAQSAEGQFTYGVESALKRFSKYE